MRNKLLLFFAGALLSCPILSGQVAPSSTGEVTHLWAGGEYSNFNPDWGRQRLPGIGIYVDLNLYKRYGIEGEARFLNFTKPGGLTEKSYLGGPYATLYRRGRLTASIRFVAGAGLVTYTGGIGYGSYFEFAPGGSIEYRMARKWKARFDYEYQWMPSAPGLPGIPDNGLTPAGFSGGLAYRVF